MAWNPSPQVAAARDFGKRFGKNKVIIIGIDEKAGTFETISYGQTKAKCYAAEKSADDIVRLIENGTIRV